MRKKITPPAMVLLVIFLILFIAGGCTNFKHASLYSHYDTLEYDPPLPFKAPPLPYTLKVEQFQNSPIYDSNRIIFKKGDYSRDEFAYHKWRALPGELVSYYLARDFAESGRFHSTLYYESGLAYTHLITGMVEDFYWLAGDSAEAVLSIFVNLVENLGRDSGVIIAQKKYQLTVKTQSPGPEGFAGAMSSAMQQVSAHVLEDVARVVSSK